MKKTLCIFLAFLICLGTGITLVSCGCKHIYSTEWSTDDTHHWHACTKQDCDDLSEKGEHDWDAGVQILAPTASTNGMRKYTCKVCGKTRTETVTADPTVSGAEWAEAFLMQDENYWITIDGTQQEKQAVKKRGGIVVVSKPQSVGLDENYYSVEDGQYYCYTVAGEQVTKAQITQQAYTQATTLIDLQVLSYASFTYNESDLTYTAAQFTTEDVVYRDVCIAFVGKLITRISFSKKEPGKETEVYNINVISTF